MEFEVSEAGSDKDLGTALNTQILLDVKKDNEKLASVVPLNNFFHTDAETSIISDDDESTICQELDQGPSVPSEVVIAICQLKFQKSLIWRVTVY